MGLDLGGVLGSGLLGLGGSLATAAIGMVAAHQAAKDRRLEKQMDQAHEIAMAERAATAAAAASVAERELAQLQGDFAGLQASIADQTALSGRVSGWAVDVMTLFRPGLTLILAAGAIGLAAAEPSLRQTIADLAALAVAWWFGSRDHHKWRSGEGR